MAVGRVAAGMSDGQLRAGDRPFDFEADLVVLLEDEYRLLGPGVLERNPHQLLNQLIQDDLARDDLGRLQNRVEVERLGTGNDRRKRQPAGDRVRATAGEPLWMAC